MCERRQKPRAGSALRDDGFTLIEQIGRASCRERV